MRKLGSGIVAVFGVIALTNAVAVAAPTSCSGFLAPGSYAMSSC